MAGQTDVLFTAQSEQVDIGNSASPRVQAVSTIIPSNSSKVVVGPYAINSGVQVTIGSGGKLQIQKGAPLRTLGVTPIDPALSLVTFATQVVLTNAQILTLPTIPITLAPAAGIGSTLVPIMMTRKYDFTAGIYSNVNAALLDNLTWGFTTNLGLTSVTLGQADFINATAKAGFTQMLGGEVTYPINISNLPLIYFLNNQGSGNLTGGNSANTLTLILYYMMVPL